MESSYPDTSYGDFDDHDEATAPKFEPPPSEPQDQSEGSASDEDNVTPGEDIPKPVSEK